MIPIEKVIAELCFIVCCVIALMISFLEIGLSNFTTIHWISVGLAVFGLITNSLIIFAKTHDMKTKIERKN